MQPESEGRPCVVCGAITKYDVELFSYICRHCAYNETIDDIELWPVEEEES
jgi:hypothetical protein